VDISESEFFALFRAAFPEGADLPPQLEVSMTLDELEDYNSLTRLELTMRLEDRFEIALEQGDFDASATVGDLLTAARSKESS